MRKDGAREIAGAEEITPSGTSIQDQSEVNRMRRALVQVGWAVPVVLAVGLPHGGRAQAFPYPVDTPEPPPGEPRPQPPEVPV